jgi:hypothetical protein
MRRVTCIAPVKNATADQRNPHDAEVIGTGDPKLRYSGAGRLAGQAAPIIGARSLLGTIEKKVAPVGA